MTTLHTRFLAGLIATSLRRHGWDAEVLTEAPADFSHDFYVVLCPQMYDRLPPGERRVCYQLEQSVSSRWFQRDYFEILENSAGVFDYSLKNIEFLADNGIAYPHVFYMPIGARDVSKKTARLTDYDLIFYGDFKSSPRRARMLESLGDRYRMRIVDEIFGDEIHELIQRSRFVLNLHYYENALLEMPRIQESLSLGTAVISEDSHDSGEYPWLEGAVTFFEEGSTQDMIRVIDAALRAEPDLRALTASVNSSWRNFEFMLDRFLIAQNFLPVESVDEIRLPDVLSKRIVSISLPETIKRRRIFEAEQPTNCSIFNGLRRSPGWIGCGLSYKALCSEAVALNKKQMIIIEDDVVLDDNFERSLAIAHRYLHTLNGNWDIFSGVIASLHDDVKVSKVERFEGIDFVTVDKMTSMVFNIYNWSAINLIAKWSPLNEHVDTNTIDRYLEDANLKVIMAHPYLAGHREEVHSTLWNFQNTQYVEMIRESENRLGRLKNEWVQQHGLVFA